MQDPENATLYLAEPSLTWPDFKSVQIHEVVQTTGRETPESLPHQSKELHPEFSKGPWTLVRFFTEKILPADFNLDLVLSDSGITINMVPNIVEHKEHGSYELVVATLYLQLLSERFHDFKVGVDYDLFKLAEEDVRIYGIWEAKERARINTLSTPAEATRNRWGYGPAEGYRNAIEKAGLRIELERVILNWDIQHTSVPSETTEQHTLASLLKPYVLWPDSRSTERLGKVGRELASTS